MSKEKGLYVHIPFCIKKCRYCDFVSYTDKQDNFDDYITALLCEANENKNTAVDTLFIGGGTPTIFSEKQLERLFTELNSIFKINTNADITIEANPKTLSAEKLTVLKNCGVNRISVGVQSFCDSELSAIGRIHNAKNAYNTVELIKKCGFDNISIDLMLSLPGQNIDSLTNTLEKAMELKPQHISCYSLILEENTPLYDDYKNGIYTAASDEYDRRIYHFAAEFLKKNGYKRYEISNFALDGFESKHNKKYWNCNEYIGLGVSAHSYLDKKRFFNTSCLCEYLNGNRRSPEITFLSENDMISEYIIMRLRLAEGICENDFYTRFSRDFYEMFKKTIDKFINGGFMAYENNYFFLTDKGIDVSNSIMCEFV